jgi:hypothetical protein
MSTARQEHPDRTALAEAGIMDESRKRLLRTASKKFDFL